MDEVLGKQKKEQNITIFLLQIINKSTIIYLKNKISSKYINSLFKVLCIKMNFLSMESKYLIIESNSLREDLLQKAKLTSVDNRKL
jgi:hypothetical protein